MVNCSKVDGKMLILSRILIFKIRIPISDHSSYVNFSKAQSNFLLSKLGYFVVKAHTISSYHNSYIITINCLKIDEKF